MTTDYSNNPAEYLHCSDAEMIAEYAGKTVDQIIASLNEILDGDNTELAQAIFKACKDSATTYGTVTYNGSEIKLHQEAYTTGRLLTEHANPGEWVEYQANGTYKGIAVIVRWHFKIDPAIENEDGYDFSNVWSVETPNF